MLQFDLHSWTVSCGGLFDEAISIWDNIIPMGYIRKDLQ